MTGGHVKVVILAGGYGTRISEESAVRPKPMVEIGGQPILWHIMKSYAAHGFHEFVVCCGYKGQMIKEYFASYRVRTSDITVDLGTDEVTVHKHHLEPWRVTLVDTGEDTMTGGRLRRVADHLDDDTFFLTYGDGVADVDLTRLLAFHREVGAKATLTAVQAPGRFGALTLHEAQPLVDAFREKPAGGGDTSWINGGFFALERDVLDYIDGDQAVWEREPLERIAAGGGLAAYRHEGFWQPMDTLRDKMVLEELWQAGEAPWRIW
jgi:glucose-1-phosphate cytidylyltransferase